MPVLILDGLDISSSLLLPFEAGIKHLIAVFCTHNFVWVRSITRKYDKAMGLNAANADIVIDIIVRRLNTPIARA